MGSFILPIICKRTSLFYLEHQCKSTACFISELGLVIKWREFVLVQFAISFTSLSKGLFKVCRSTP